MLALVGAATLLLATSANAQFGERAASGPPEAVGLYSEEEVHEYLREAAAWTGDHRRDPKSAGVLLDMYTVASAVGRNDIVGVVRRELFLFHPASLQARFVAADVGDAKDYIRLVDKLMLSYWGTVDDVTLADGFLSLHTLGMAAFGRQLLEHPAMASRLALLEPLLDKGQPGSRRAEQFARSRRALEELEVIDWQPTREIVLDAEATPVDRLLRLAQLAAADDTNAKSLIDFASLVVGPTDSDPDIAAARLLAARGDRRWEEAASISISPVWNGQETSPSIAVQRAHSLIVEGRFNDAREVLKAVEHEAVPYLMAAADSPEQSDQLRDELTASLQEVLSTMEWLRLEVAYEDADRRLDAILYEASDLLAIQVKRDGELGIAAEWRRDSSGRFFFAKTGTLNYGREVPMPRISLTDGGKLAANRLSFGMESRDDAPSSLVIRMLNQVAEDNDQFSYYLQLFNYERGLLLQAAENDRAAVAVQVVKLDSFGQIEVATLQQVENSVTYANDAGLKLYLEYGNESTTAVDAPDWPDGPERTVEEFDPMMLGSLLDLFADYARVMGAI